MATVQKRLKATPPEPGKWRILIDGVEIESWRTEEVARRQLTTIRRTTGAGREVKLIRPDGTED